MQPPASPSLLSPEKNILNEDFIVINKLRKSYLNEMPTAATNSFDTIQNEEEENGQFKSYGGVDSIKKSENVTTIKSSKLDFILTKLWFIGDRKRRNYRASKKNGTLVKTNTNLSSQLSNNSFVLETKPKPPKLIADDEHGSSRLFSDTPFQIHNHHHFFSSQINFYQNQSPHLIQRTISQKFNSSRSMANLHSRNIRMMSLTVKFFNSFCLFCTIS